jgi:hypothetical protein
LAPAFNWIDTIVVFNDFIGAVRFGHELALADGVTKKLVTALAWPIPSYFRGLEPFFPKGRPTVIAMIADHSVEPFLSLAGAHHGEVTYRRSTDESMGARPLYEYTWNHTTLHALNVDRDITYLQSLYPASGFTEKVAEIAALFPPDEVLQHLDFTRHGGLPAAFGIDLIKFTTPERLREIMDIHQQHGVPIADPHV